MNENENLPLYPRITAYCGVSYGEDIYCRPCREVQAVCPDCEAAMCVTCMDECPSCETSIF